MIHPMKIWLALGASALVTAATFNANADGMAEAAPGATNNAAATAKADKTYTGIVAQVNPGERTLEVRNWTGLKRTFNLGETCLYAQLGNNHANAGDLRLGERVTVSYQELHGVRVADRVEQIPMRVEGEVRSLDPATQTLVVHHSIFDKSLQYPGDCKVVLRDGKVGVMSDIKVGNHVIVTYDTPAAGPVAWEVTETSIPFTGTVTAVDLNERTVKARGAFTSMKFVLGNNCAIVVNGKTGGHLADLRLKEKVRLNYDEINGVAIVNCIAPADASTPPATAVATAPPTTTGF